VDAAEKAPETEPMAEGQSTDDLAALLTAAGEALSAGRWEEARAGFEATLEIEESGAALFGLALALWWMRDPVSSVSLQERAFGMFRREGASRRRRYERLARFPRGLVAVGDAISSFNPVYGQGMSVAALEAVALRQTLTSGKRRLSERYFKASGKIVDIAWDLAIGSDLSLPEVAGQRLILTRLSNAWAERILTAAEHDAYVAAVFGSVTDLLATPTVLMRPRFVWRVARSRAGKQRDRVRVTVGDPKPSTRMDASS
jgi:hypothetical protein